MAKELSVLFCLRPARCAHLIHVFYVLLNSGTHCTMRPTVHIPRIHVDVFQVREKSIGFVLNCVIGNRFLEEAEEEKE